MALLKISRIESDKSLKGKPFKLAYIAAIAVVSPNAVSSTGAATTPVATAATATATVTPVPTNEITSPNLTGLLEETSTTYFCYGNNSGH